MMKTVVLGAGPAGLACADVLTQAGRRVAVFERAPGVGGLTRTVVRNWFRFDLGGHRWFTKNQELNQYFLELMDGELVQVQRISRIFFRGRFCKYPLEPLDVLKSLSPLSLARIFLDYSWSRLRVNHQPDRSFEDWVVRRFGRVLFELFFRSYSEKVWGIPCDRISADWAAQRIRNLSIPAMIRSSLFGNGDGGPKSLVDQFWYPALGYGRITERLAERITPRNSIHLRAEVIALRHDGGRVRAVRIRTEAGEEWVDVDHVVSSIPITELVRRMQPHAPAHVRDAADSLTFRNLITVHLMLKKKQVSADTWVYIQDPEFHMARFHEPKNWSALMVPDASVTSLVCEYFCNQEDEFWSRSEPDIVDLAARELATMGFLHTSEVSEGFIIRIRQAYPVYSTTYQNPLDTIKGYLAGFSNLQTVGRYGRFRYNNTDHALETGILAARNILGSRYDLDCVNNEAEYLEEIGEPRRSEAKRAKQACQVIGDRSETGDGPPLPAKPTVPPALPER